MEDEATRVHDPTKSKARGRRGGVSIDMYSKVMLADRYREVDEGDTVEGDVLVLECYYVFRLVKPHPERERPDDHS